MGHRPGHQRRGRVPPSPLSFQDRVVDLSRAPVDKAGRTFLVTEPDGSLPLGGGHPLGFFRDDARHLSGYALRGDGVAVTRSVLPDGRIEERITSGGEVELTLDADFEPMLILRGAAAPLPPVEVEVRPQPDGLELRGRARDGAVRFTRVHASPAPSSVDGRVLRFSGRAGIRLVYELGEDGVADVPLPPPPAVSIRCDDPDLDAVLARALDDLAVLRTPLEGRTYPAAGVPWYVALFGRDSLITLLQAAPFLGDAAAGALGLLAANIGARVDRVREEQPGKILHELRSGELARLEDHTPLSRYYGTVDATPLFLCALAEDAAWTGSTALYTQLSGAVDAALGWVDDRLLTYTASPGGGLRHQAWKDSDDGLPDADGSQPDDPVAVVEAAGYAVAAKRAVARLAELAGDPDRAAVLRESASAAEALVDRFWLPDRGFYSMALGGATDSSGTPLRSLGSNQGHLLWARAVPPDRAAAVREALLSPAMWTGWGVRTLAADEAAYDPDSYHRGSVWPHDTAMFAAGLRAYGFDEAFLQVTNGLLDAAAVVPDQRLPELFSGKERVPGAPPETYAAACRPQAWAAGSVLMLVRAALDLQPSGTGWLSVRRPLLPGRATELSITGLPVGAETVDLRFTRSPDGTVEVDGSGNVDLAVP